MAAIVTEITNTPWRERQAYVLSLRPVADSDPQTGAIPQVPTTSSTVHRFVFRKRFHISPFNSMDQEHDWRFSITAQRFAVAMRNQQDGRTVFDADLILDLEPATPAAILRHCLAWPVTCIVMLLEIYRQALSLWWKRVPIHDHPTDGSPSVAVGAKAAGPPAVVHPPGSSAA